MMKLINLECKRNKIKVFFVAFLIISIVILGLTYFFALVSRVKPEAAATNSFITTYEYVFSMVQLISLASFSIFSSVLFSKFIIEEYKGDSLYLLFSYPLSRKKVFLSKIILSISFTFFFSIVSQAFVYLLFMVSESIVPIMSNDVFTWNLLIASLPKIFLVGLQSVVVGLIAMQIGFIKRSLPTTIVASVAISIIFCNILTIGSQAILNIITVVFYIILSCTITLQARFIETLEIEE